MEARDGVETHSGVDHHRRSLPDRARGVHVIGAVQLGLDDEEVLGVADGRRSSLKCRLRHWNDRHSN